MKSALGVTICKIRKKCTQAILLLKIVDNPSHIVAKWFTIYLQVDDGRNLTAIRFYMNLSIVYSGKIILVCADAQHQPRVFGDGGLDR